MKIVGIQLFEQRSVTTHEEEGAVVVLRLVHKISVLTTKAATCCAQTSKPEH